MEYINQLILGDSLDILKKIPRNSIDLIFTDPPYNISKERIFTFRSKRKNITLNFGEWDHYSQDEYIRFIEKFKIEVYRILKETGNIIMFIDYYQLGLLKEYFESFYMIETFFWIKNNPPPKVLKNSMRSAIESIFIARKSKDSTFNFFKQEDMKNYLILPLPDQGKRIHPTQKPVLLCEHLINIYSNEGDLILDPFMGSGSTIVASINRNRKYIGIEKDPNYYYKAKERIEHARKQNSINTIWSA